MPDTRDRLLEIYLAAHLAAATAGVALVRRVARSNSTSEADDVLQRLSREIDEDRRTLQRVVAALGFAESKPKQLLARAAEKVGRLKLNGQLRGYSPLSRVLELEALSIGIVGKLALWQTLQRLPDIAERFFRHRSKAVGRARQASARARRAISQPPRRRGIRRPRRERGGFLANDPLTRRTEPTAGTGRLTRAIT